MDGPAVVVGASMAGLLAARALSEHFSQVLVVERDQLPEAPGPRKGVPQARHAHVLLVRGRQILEQYFPGLVDELVASGATLFDNGADTRLLTAEGWTPRFNTELCTVACSRDLLEWHVRRRLAAHPRVRFLPQQEAVDLLPDPSGDVVAGVRVRSRADGGAATEELRAAFVVDASGRGSRAPEWLSSLGYARPPETTVNAFMGYASRLYAPPEGFVADWKVLNILPRPPGLLRGGVILPIEGGRWMVTLAGFARDYPPLDDEGFLAFAQSLAGPLLYDSIRVAQPISPISGYQRTENRMRHYERLPRWPERFAVTGDAVSAFNPVYGQGMTNAAIGAQLLDETLRAGLAGAGRRFQHRLARHNRTPWLMATNQDYTMPETESMGARPGLSTRLSQWYLTHVLVAAVHQPEVYLPFAEVAHFLRPPTALLSPRVVARVARQALGGAGHGGKS